MVLGLTRVSCSTLPKGIKRIPFYIATKLFGLYVVLLTYPGSEPVALIALIRHAEPSTTSIHGIPRDFKSL